MSSPLSCRYRSASTQTGWSCGSQPPAGAKLPSYPPFALTPGIPPVKELFDQKFVQPVDYQLGSEYAPLERLLQADLLGRKRPAGQFDVGPLVDLPLDGSAIKVDPRRTRK